MSGFGDILTDQSAKRIQRDGEWEKSDKFKEWKDPPVPRNPKAGPPIPEIRTGHCAVVLDDKAGYCGAPNGDNAFRFCDFHAARYLNKLVRTR